MAPPVLFRTQGTRPEARKTMRSLASPGLGLVAAAGRWLSCLLLAAIPSAASAQYMALTAPPKPDLPRAAPPDAPKPVPLPARPAEHAFNGSLPNQRTGPARQRVVRDICIGCDR